MARSPGGLSVTAAIPGENEWGVKNRRFNRLSGNSDKAPDSLSHYWLLRWLSYPPPAAIPEMKAES